MRRSLLTAVLLAASLACGCISEGPEQATTKQQVYETLNAVILDPFTSCEELRAGFRVEHLPVVYDPAGLGLTFQEYYIPAFDSTPLRIWYLPSLLNRGTVILSMGATGSMPCYLFTAQLMIENGWSVVMYDYRGFGGSGGVPGLAALTPDLHAILDWTLRETGLASVTLMGISLGSIPSVAVAVDRATEVNGVILDSPVALGLEIQRFNFAIGDAAAFLELLDPQLLSERIIAAMTTPMLILLNENDRLTPPAQTELLFELSGGPKELARFPGIGHARGVFRDTEYYTYRVESFLSRVWGQFDPLPIIRE